MALNPTTAGGGGPNLWSGTPGTATPYTVMLWQYFNSVANGTGVFSRNAGAEVYLWDNGTPKLYWDDLAFYGTTTIAVNTWYHLAFTLTGAVSEMWVNGVSQGTDVAPGGTPVHFALGYRNTSNSRREAVKFWGALLSDEEILQELYFNMPVRTADLERWHHFDTPGSTFRDYSGTGTADFSVYGSPTQGNPGPPITWRKGASKIFVPLGVAADISHVAALADSFDTVVQRRPIKVTNF